MNEQLVNCVDEHKSFVSPTIVNWWKAPIGVSPPLHAICSPVSLTYTLNVVDALVDVGVGVGVEVGC